MTDDGLESNVIVTLWDTTTKTAITSAVVPQGTGALLIDHFRYAHITGGPVTLAANTYYALSFNSGDILDNFQKAASPSVLNTYFIGDNTSDTWALAYSADGLVGSYPESDSLIIGFPMGGMSYGCVNLLGRATIASSPDPEDGTQNVGDANSVSGKVDVMLRWKTGTDPCDYTQPNPNITKHYVYLAINDVNLNPGDGGLFAEVTVSAGSPVDADGELAVGGLNFDTPYYWRIDESVSDSGPSAAETLTGDVWSFTAKGEEPVITDEPDNLLVEDGEAAAVFTVGVSSISQAHYQWYKSADAVVGGDSTVGTDADTYIIANADQDTDDAWYYVIVTNDGSSGSETSEVVHLVENERQPR